jgi:hypothetical protein
MEGLRVATINMSWEANNARPENGYKPAGVPPGKARAFDLSRVAWATRPVVPDGSFGPAYEQIVRDLKAMSLDVILLQEFQAYPMPNGASLDTLVDDGHLSDYTVAAVSRTTGRSDPPAASVVLVRTAILERGAPIRDVSAFWADSGNAFPVRGRPVAIADVTLHVPGKFAAEYRIISSHSAHGIKWAVPGVVQEYLDSFAAIVPAPRHLVWGGDFNSTVSGRDTTWLGRPIRKVAQADVPRNTTQFRAKYDWVLGTSVTSRNPTGVEIVDTASDHRIVAQTLRAPFSDLC